ncbi:MAG: hypothetical protein IT537_28755 [Hyphomicrobiales bacterium]|nr:hypothetical protein [Hyphomicrobiales bacterium]
MRPLLAAVATWVAQEFSMPDGQGAPLVKLAPSTTITALRHERLAPSAALEPVVETPSIVPPSGDTVAIYIDSSQTIYLPEVWNGRSAADLSILVHEMVHHFQNVLNVKSECPQEREKLAYRAQERWLGLFGRSLESEFGLDGFSLLPKTRCFY